jgi:succinyl-diaminopimelate desuccinylase
MAANGFRPDHCLLGEPTNTHEMGEEIKIGRRGSYSATLTLRGVQGHVAYPQFFNNPLTGMVEALARLKAEPLDGGSAHFAASNLEITAIDTGNPTVNLVPARATAKINVRFNDRQTPESLTAWISARAQGVAQARGLSAELTVDSIADNFYTPPGPWVETLVDIVREVTGRTPEFSTRGGASDGRFIKDHMPVVEFGLCNETIHKVNENAPLADIEALALIYRRFLDLYFA